MSGVFSSAKGLFKVATGQSQKAQKKARESKTSPADCVSLLLFHFETYILTDPQISWSGCKDSQTSADTVEAGSATGAMSYVSGGYWKWPFSFAEVNRSIRRHS